MRYDSLCEAQQILCRYTARIVVWNTTDTGDSMENLKRGDIVKRYNDDKGIYQYGVVADTLIFLGNKCIISLMYRKEAMNFYTWTDDESSFMRIEQESFKNIRTCEG